MQGTFKTAENANEDKNREFFRTTKSSLDGYTLPQTTTGRAKNDSYMNCSHNHNDFFLKSSDMVIKGSGVVPPGEISECTEKKSMTRNAHLSRGADYATSSSGRLRRRSTCFAMVYVNTGGDFLNGLRTCDEAVDGSSFYINEPITGFLGQLRCRGK